MTNIGNQKVDDNMMRTVVNYLQKEVDVLKAANNECLGVDICEMSNFISIATISTQYISNNRYINVGGGNMVLSIDIANRINDEVLTVEYFDMALSVDKVTNERRHELLMSDTDEDNKKLEEANIVTIYDYLSYADETDEDEEVVDGSKYKFDESYPLYCTIDRQLIEYIQTEIVVVEEGCRS